MRYFCTNMRSLSNWVESNLESETAIIEKYFEKKLRFYDSDSGGDETYYFAFSTGRFFKLYHDWYIERDPEWDLIHTTEITEVTYDEIPHDERSGLCEDRDYLTLKRGNTRHEHRFVAISDDDPWSGIKI